MKLHWKLIVILVLLVIGSTWLLKLLGPDPATRKAVLEHDPDYYMEDFSTLTMEQDGEPKNRLFAEYMAHYRDDDTTELVKPRLEVYRRDKTPVIIIADKGWVTAGNDVILLKGDVKLWQNDLQGQRELEIITSDVKILMEEEYAETDEPATLIGKKTTVHAIGVRAYLKESRLELLNNVRGTILPENNR